MKIDIFKKKMGRPGISFILAFTLLFGACEVIITPTINEAPVNTAPVNFGEFHSNVPIPLRGQCLDISLGHKTKVRAYDSLGDLVYRIIQVVTLYDFTVFRYTGKDQRYYYASYILFQCEGVTLRTTTFQPLLKSRKKAFKKEIKRELKAQGYVVWGFDEESYNSYRVIITVIYYKAKITLRTASATSSDSENTQEQEDVEDFMADPDNQELFDAIKEFHIDRFLNLEDSEE